MRNCDFKSVYESEPNLGKVIDLAEKNISTIKRISKLLSDRACASKEKTDLEVFEKVIEPSISQAARSAEVGLYHMVVKAAKGNHVETGVLLEKFQEHDEALKKFEGFLLYTPPGSTSRSCTSETGWAVASIAFAIGTCAVSIGIGCIGGAVFGVKALDDATKACQ